MQFAILISVLVALILSAFLLLTHVHSFFKIKSKEVIFAFEQSNKQLFESLETTTTTTDTITITEENHTVKQFVDYHGSWLKRYVGIDIHNQAVSRIAYTGAALTDKTPNLYIEDTNSPIVVVGNTRLEGNSYLPKQGIKAGTISGTYYQGTNLYYGRAIESNAKLPDFSPEWLQYLENSAQGALLENGNLIPIKKELTNSFQNTIQILYDTSAIFLGDEKITGNIVVQSDTKITIGAATQLTDVLLIAPEIIIHDRVKGRFQCIATKKIKVGAYSQLYYPSSLTLLDQKKPIENTQNNTLQQPDFEIGTGTMIQGSIAYLIKKQETNRNRIKTNMAIAPNVRITGEVYCRGNIDFQGIIMGSLYAKQCIARQSGSIYLNHIFNGKVLINPIDDYAGLPFKNTKHTVAKWLY